MAETKVQQLITARDMPDAQGNYRRGPTPGQIILTHPRRNEINALIFEERLPLETMRRTLRERFNLNVSWRSLRSYREYYKNTYLTDVLATPGVVVLDQVEKDAQKTYNLLKKMLKTVETQVDNGMFIRAEDAGKLIKLHFQMLGGPNALRLITAEKRYQEGLTAVMEAIQEECDSATKSRVQYRLEHDSRFKAAMEARLDEIDQDTLDQLAAEEDDDDEAA